MENSRFRLSRVTNRGTRKINGSTGTYRCKVDISMEITHWTGICDGNHHGQSY